MIAANNQIQAARLSWHEVGCCNACPFCTLQQSYYTIMNHLTDALTHVAQAVVPVDTAKHPMMRLCCELAPSDYAQWLWLKADVCSISDIV